MLRNTNKRERTRTSVCIDTTIFFRVCFLLTRADYQHSKGEKMAKTKTPFLSLGAKGSVGESLTAQKRHKGTLIRTKPLPSDPYSLPQAYQRWLYQDYAYLWTQQSEVTRRLYALKGSPYHLTGFQYWMKVMLSTLPDIAVWYKCDINQEATTPDSSSNGNTATVIGASAWAGPIAGGFSFDGLNDMLQAADAPSLRLTTGLTIEFLISISAQFPANVGLVDKNLTQAYSVCGLTTSRRPRIFIVTAGGADNLNSIALLTLNTVHHVAFTYNQALMACYLDGAFVDSKAHAFGGPISTSNSPLRIGNRNDAAGFAGVYLDNIIIYNRALDAAEILRHSQRSYFPSPAAPPAPPVPGEWRVSASSDDCYARPSRLGGDDVFSLASNHFPGGWGGGATDHYSCGARFLAVAVPNGATITAAYLTFTSKDNLNATTVNTNIIGEAVNDAVTFTNLANYEGRARTAAIIPWDNIGAWINNVEYQSPSIVSIIQEIVDRPGWASGQDIVVFWEDDSSTAQGAYRNAHSWNSDPTKALKLHITYTP